MTQDALMQRMITAGVNILNPQEVFDFYHAQNLIDLNELRTFVDQWIATAIAEKVDQDDLDEMQLAADAVKAQLESQINSVTQLAQSNQLNLTSKADVVDLEQTNAQVELNRLALLNKADLTALAMLTTLVGTKADQVYVNQQIANLVDSDAETVAAIQAISTALSENEDLLDALEYTVANRVRFDVATQALTSLQKSNARTNIGAESLGTAATLVAAITAASIGAATAAQGSKADTALQSADVAPVALSGLFSSLSGQNKIFDVVFGAYALGSNAAVVATDTLGQIIGKLQAQINNVNPSAAMMPVNVQTDTAYTLALTDAGNCVEMNNASANTLTIPPNSTIAYDVGTTILIRQMGTGQTTIVAGSGVTLRNPHGTLKLFKQYTSVALHKRAIDEWCIEGNLAES